MYAGIIKSVSASLQLDMLKFFLWEQNIVYEAVEPVLPCFM